MVHPDSNRVAPDDTPGLQVHLRESTVCRLDSEMQSDLDISPPHDWNYAVALYDQDTGTWSDIRTFDSLEAADDEFVAETNDSSNNSQSAERLTSDAERVAVDGKVVPSQQ